MQITGALELQPEYMCKYNSLVTDQCLTQFIQPQVVLGVGRVLADSGFYFLFLSMRGGLVVLSSFDGVLGDA